MKLIKLLLTFMFLVAIMLTTGCSNSQETKETTKNTIEGTWVTLEDSTIETVKIEKLGEQYVATGTRYIIWHEPLFNNETVPVDATFRINQTYNAKKANLNKNQLDIPETRTFLVLENDHLKGKFVPTGDILNFIRLTDNNKNEIIEKAKEHHIQILKEQGKDTNRIKFKLDPNEIKL